MDYKSVYRYHYFEKTYFLNPDSVSFDNVAFYLVTITIVNFPNKDLARGNTRYTVYIIMVFTTIQYTIIELSG